MLLLIGFTVLLVAIGCALACDFSRSAASHDLWYVATCLFGVCGVVLVLLWLAKWLSKVIA